MTYRKYDRVTVKNILIEVGKPDKVTYKSYDIYDPKPDNGYIKVYNYLPNGTTTIASINQGDIL